MGDDRAVPTASPTLLISWAHSDPGATEQEQEQRRDDVVRLAFVLRDNGVSADLDLFHLSEPVDWTRWGPSRVAEVDYVLVAVSPAWRQAWEGAGDSRRGGGAAAEADTLRSVYNRDRAQFMRKVRLVLLPGASRDDIPDGLHGVNRFTLHRIDAAAAEDLLRDVTGQPQFVPPPVGAVPLLPPTLPASAEPMPRATPSDGRDPETDPAAEAQRLHALLNALPVPEPGEGPHLPWFRTYESARRRLAQIEASEQAVPPPSPSKVASAPVLRWGLLTRPPSIAWRDEWDNGPHRGVPCVAVHAVPLGAAPLTARMLTEMPAALAAKTVASHPSVRWSARPEDGRGGIAVLADPDEGRGEAATGRLVGIRVSDTAQLSAWYSLPRDMLGAVLDPDHLPAVLMRCLRGCETARTAAGVSVVDYAVALEVGPSTMLSLASQDAVGKRSSATMHSWGAQPLRIPPDETVDHTALGANADELGGVLARVMLRALRQR